LNEIIATVIGDPVAAPDVLVAADAVVDVALGVLALGELVVVLLPPHAAKAAVHNPTATPMVARPRTDRRPRRGRTTREPIMSRLLFLT
jgi:hypothetical protein